MTDDATSEPAERLYDQLQDRLRARDKEGAIEAYYQLFLAGRPLGEVISKGAFDQVGYTDSEPHNPSETAPIERAASALGGLAASDDSQSFNPELFEPGCDISSDVQADSAASGSNSYAQRWYVWRKHWVVGGLVGFGALVVPIALVYDTNLETKPGPTFTGLNVELNMTPSSKPAGAMGSAVGAVAEAVPAPPVAADASRKAVATATRTREDRADRSGRPPPSKSADAPDPATGAAAEAVPSPPVAVEGSSKIVATATRTREDGADRSGRPTTTKSADAPDPATGAAAEAVPTPPVAADASPKFAEAATTARGSPGPSGTETKALVSRADALLGIGDLTAARLFYRRGADLGDGTAALRLGETFDPAFLQQAGLGHVAGDVERALYWYRRAQDLGNRDASLLAKGLHPPGSNQQ